MSQTSRILTALQNGPVNPVDFDLPNVIDGGKPIQRVAARILDLRAAGHEIASTKQPNGTVTYRLVRDVEQSNRGNTAAKTTETVTPTSVALLGVSPPPKGSDGTPPPSEPTLFNQEAA